mmetsp:Transcript_13601/g.31829  ORF Transcript_13601/g.31829 Transcript_13601/m.31829 type:complete len:126 (+) Transcript_13601:731-1108(+)
MGPWTEAITMIEHATAAQDTAIQLAFELSSGSGPVAVTGVREAARALLVAIEEAEEGIGHFTHADDDDESESDETDEDSDEGTGDDSTDTGHGSSGSGQGAWSPSAVHWPDWTVGWPGEDEGYES